MGWKFQEKPRTVLASKSLVDEFATMEPAPYDRPLSERRMQVYERILRSGAFRPVTWASAVCGETNCTYRVNGKHTSTLLSRLDKIPDFHVIVERYWCDTLQDVGNLYNTFDSNLASRNNSDINLSFASTLPELREMPARLINLTVTSASYLKWDDTTLRRVPQAEKAEELMDRADFVKWLYVVLKSTGTGTHSLSKHLIRSPVITAMMATHDRSPKVATEFWELVRDESHPERNHQTRVLSRYLVRANMTTGPNARNREKVGFREMYVKCLHAWNAFRSGETTNLQYYAKAPIPQIKR